ncbi:RbsD/FucU family protein [Aestuariimicrobium soli]|uniref:RbsD/FucU family protein n=1 Tax=Aestuariimicrobium soli TaxID=2035834 RepID=UPI003EBBCAE3
MLRTPILHPDLLAGLARCGHGSQVLIADALFPHATGADPAVPRVHLNLTPGTVPAAQIVALVAEACFIEAAAFMADPEAPGGESPAVGDYRGLLADHRHWGGREVTWEGVERMAFYEACWQRDVALVIATGEVRPYANLLLTLGVP